LSYAPNLKRKDFITPVDNGQSFSALSLQAFQSAQARVKKAGRPAF
jgi:hypothetical protein